MCGIYGLIQSTGPLRWSGSQVRSMAELLSPRGPDDHGFFEDTSVHLGMRRLAIIDVENGRQPIFNEDKSLLVIYNGELYNYKELREKLINKGHTFTTRCDTEVIVHAFEEYGASCVEKFNGMFAFAVYDLKEHRLFLARDRLGIKPLYYHYDGKGLVFASEAKALLPVIDSVDVDWTAINRFFHFGYIPSPESPFRDIQQLPQGTIAEWKNGTITTRSYWVPEYSPDKQVDLSTAVKELDGLLDECISKEMMSDVPLGIFLSGGLDSSAIGLYAARHSTVKLKSFGIRFTEKTHDESEDSRLVAKHLNIDHYEIPFTSNDQVSMLLEVAETLDEPFGDSTLLPLLKLARETRKHVKVVLTGWGGDELFAGYPTYRAHRYAGWYRRLPRWLGDGLLPWCVGKMPVSDRYMSPQFKASRFIQGMMESPEIQHFLWMGYFTSQQVDMLFTSDTMRQVKENAYEVVREQMKSFSGGSLLDRILYLDARFFLEGNGLFQCDRMTMAASLEARVPLLNNKLIDFVNYVPDSVKMASGQPKELFRSVLRPHLPKKIIVKPKKGFGPPTSTWMRGELVEVFKEVFEEKRIQQQGVLNVHYIKQLLDEHRLRKADNGRTLWALLSFQLWYERYILKTNLVDLVEH